MKNKDKVIVVLLILGIVFSLSLKYWKYVVEKDYFIYMHIPCQSEYSCFAYEEEEPYLKLYKKAFEVEKCSETGTCDPLSCAENEEDCSIVTCSDDALEEDEVCVDPELKD